MQQEDLVPADSLLIPVHYQRVRLLAAVVGSFADAPDKFGWRYRFDDTVFMAIWHDDGFFVLAEDETAAAVIEQEGDGVQVVD